MSAQHTPGPWAIETDHDEDIQDTVMIHGAADAPGMVPVAIVYTADAFPCVEDEDRAAFEAECKANARLIAAAPELLDTCEALAAFTRDLLKLLTPEQIKAARLTTRMIKLNDKAYNVLAKARGEKQSGDDGDE